MSGQRVVFRRTGADTDGELLELETWYSAGAPPAPPHYHPSQDEHFEVLSGAVRCEIDGEERVLREGDVLDVPRGTVHEFGGHPEEDGHVRWETRPAGRTEDFLRGMFEAGTDGERVGALLAEHTDVFRLAV